MRMIFARHAHPCHALGVILLHRTGLVALWVSVRCHFLWRHWYAAGLSRHEVACGPIYVEWAFKPRSVSREQARRETTDAVAATIRKKL